MPPITEAQTIECFHLAFVQVLLRRMNPGNVAVKGGANLRYFFDSHRYSEDIDFDVVAGEAWKLSDVVDETIEGPALSGILRTTGIRVAHTNKQKQTSTTQRWKLLLATPAIKQPVSTKIEFSRRNGDDRFLLEAVPERVVAAYGLRPPTIQHYTAAPATEQKIRALAGRTETQARDVFDLDLLFRSHPGAVEPGALDRESLEAAIQRCLELPFEAFDGQVVSFLEPEIAELYSDRQTWEQMQIYVADRLEEFVHERD